MKYTTEIEIHAPIEKVALLLRDHAQMKYWIKELQSYEPINGNPDQEGAKTRMAIDVGKQITVTETVTKIEFPYRITTHYEMEHGSFIADSLLQASTENLTRFTLNHYFKFTGMFKIATALLRPAFIKHSQRMMVDFKNLAEKQNNYL